jgi:hypothetical protein
MSNTDSFSIVVSPTGKISTVYRDDLVELLAQGKSETKRASHVDPIPCHNTWSADMSPSDGPKLLGFKTRGEALEAERNWLENKLRT